MLERAIVGLLRVGRKKAAGHLPRFEMVGHAIAANPTTMTPHVATTAIGEILVFFAFHRSLLQNHLVRNMQRFKRPAFVIITSPGRGEKNASGSPASGQSNFILGMVAFRR
jgi:hypothetical protein